MYVFSTLQRRYGPCKITEFPKMTTTGPRSKNYPVATPFRGTKRVSPDFQNLRLLLESGASN
jgi:hypothetical protein